TRGGAVTKEAGVMSARSLIVLISGWVPCLAAGCAYDELYESTGVVEVCADRAGEQCTAPFNLGAYRVGESHTVSLAVANRGAGVLRVTAVTATGGGLSVTNFPDSVE